jgi:ubiquinone/menaquinone biosynthesis C-methylase UbiE
MTNPAVRPDDYIMGRTTAEYQRLRSQARALEPVTRRVLERVGVGEGMNCVDVGCGAGDVMRILAELVGPTGRVTGIDLDGRLGAQALAALGPVGGSRSTFVQGDAAAMAEVAGQPFDLAFARLVLIHAMEPAAVLRRMYGWLRPGGWLVVQDFDLQGVSLDAAGEAGQEFKRIVFGVFEAAGRDVQAGHHLPEYFAAAGLGSPDGTDLGGCLTPMAEAVSMMEGVYRSVLPHALKLGLTTEARSEVLLAELAAVGARNEGWGRWPLLISAWKRKAGRSLTEPAHDA